MRLPKRCPASTSSSRKRRGRWPTTRGPKPRSGWTRPTKPIDELDALQSNDVVLMELAVRPRAELVGRSATDIDLRHLFGINLLAIAREGNRSTARLRSTPIMAGDVLLMQGNPEAISEFANRFGCVPLAARPLRIPDQTKAILATVIMLAAIAGPALGLVPAAVSFAGGRGGDRGCRRPPRAPPL